MRIQLWAIAALITALPAQTIPDTNPQLASVRAAASQVALGNQATDRVHFDQPHRDGSLWALGRSWKASFDQTGSTVIPFFGSLAPRNFPLRLEVARASVGGKPLTLTTGQPSVTGTTVRTNRGAFVEVLATEPDSIEQSFVFTELPNRNAIAVDVRIETELTPSVIEGGLRFANEYGHVDYTKAIAVDANGERLALDIAWTGSCAHMEIPASFVARAQLPIVLDPVLNYWYLLGSGQTQLQHDSDVATIQVQALGGRTLLVWQRQWSATDQDCFGLMFDNNLALVQTDFSIDFTSEDWVKVAVAGNNYAQNFLVVAEIRIGQLVGSLHYIGGRGSDTNAAVGAEFDIERDGVVGSGGNNFHPDVGSDPYFGVGRYTVVFEKRAGFASDIYMKQVTTAGGLVTSNPIALDLSASEESRPAISKSCGQSNGLPAYWLVTWQRTYSINDQDIYGRFVNWNGALPGSEFAIATSITNETTPSPSSPIDANNVRYWPMCHEYATGIGQPRDITCRLLRGDGSMQATFTASSNVPGADDHSPEVDSDGTRFVAVFTTGTTGFPQGPEAVTIAYLPATNSFRVDERTGLITSSLDNYDQCNICAEFSGGTAATPRYLLSFTEQASNTFRLEAYGGHTGGNFFTNRVSQCGNLSLQVTGSPVIGQSITATVGLGPVSGTILGFPGWIPLQAIGCNCSQGVVQGTYLSNPLVWTIPNNPAFVGIALSVQGWTIAGTQCLGFVDLSDTVDFTIR